MGIDASIYSNVKQPEPISPIDNAQKAMTLSSLGMQQAQMQRQMMTQQAAQHAYLSNTDQNGNLNREGFLSELSKTNPQAAMEHQQQFYAQDKSHAEAQAAQADAAQKTLSFTIPMMHHLAGMPEEQRASAYSGVMKQLQSYGVDTSRMGDTYDPGVFRQTYDRVDAAGANAKQLLENQKTQVEITKTQAETPFIQAKNKAELANSNFGSRSPNAEISSQYANDPAVKATKLSQGPMNQMMDNYENRTPQGDESLVLNAFKIKFPNAPDVQSLDALQHSQSVSDTAKQWASKTFQGLKDPGTRDNLLRDAISTYRGQMTTLRGAQKKYLDKANQQGIPQAQGITSEPGLEQTMATAQDYQDKLGPYIPPSQRGGVGGAIAGAASKLFGVGGAQTANAADALPPPPKHGTVDSGYVFMGGDPSKQSSWKKQ